MTVLDVFRIKGRGLVITTKLDGACPLKGDVLIRVSDGQTWMVWGVERFAKFLGTMGTHGENVGILLRDDGPDPVRGDQIERF